MELTCHSATEDNFCGEKNLIASHIIWYHLMKNPLLANVHRLWSTIAEMIPEDWASQPPFSCSIPDFPPALKHIPALIINHVGSFAIFNAACQEGKGGVTESLALVKFLQKWTQEKHLIWMRWTLSWILKTRPQSADVIHNTKPCIFALSRSPTSPLQWCLSYCCVYYTYTAFMVRSCFLRVFDQF